MGGVNSGRKRAPQAKIQSSPPPRPTPPPYLDAMASKEFDYLAGVLETSGTLHQCDPKLLELYALNYSVLVRAYTELQSQPLTLGSSGSRLFINPLIGMIHNSSQKVRQIVSDLGLSPVSAKLVEGRLPSVNVTNKWSGLLGDDD